MDNICSYEECKNEKYKAFDECILHCDKSKFEVKKGNWESEFYDKLRAYTVDYLLRGENTESKKAKEWHLLRYFNHDNKFEGLLPVESYKSKLNITGDISFEGIIFPVRNDEMLLDYFEILKNLDRIFFVNCQIYFDSIEKLRSKQIMFLRSKFKGKWYVYPHFAMDMEQTYQYMNCNFENNVHAGSNELEYKSKQVTAINNNLFENCNFHQKLSILDLNLGCSIFKKSTKEIRTIKEVIITNCKITEKFILNNYNINYFECKDSILEDIFECKSNIISEINIENSKFNEFTDCYSSDFGKFLIKNSRFDELLNFEECKFGRIRANQKPEECVAIFDNVTFLGIVNFRHTKFYYGLDIEKVNLKEFMNFFGTYIKFEYTNRDTFRRIKYSFDKIGNHIEANKYFKEEMEKYRLELKERKGHFWEKFVFWVNKLTSDYGQSYIKPIGLILLLMVIHTAVYALRQENILYEIKPDLNLTFEFISKWINLFAKSLIPLKNLLNEGFEFISMLFYISYVVLIYQTVVALKRLTKR